MPKTSSALLLNLQQGSESPHWEEFVEVYRPLIADAAVKAGARRSDVDDVIQGVLLQLVKVLPGFTYQPQRGRFRAWIRRVTTNLVYDLRRRRRLDIFLMEEIDDEAVAVEAPADDQAEWTLELLESAMKYAQVQCRPRTWSCFELHVLQCQSAAQVGLLLGVTANAVLINSHRVKTHIREFYDLHGEELHSDDHLPLLS